MGSRVQRGRASREFPVRQSLTAQEPKMDFITKMHAEFSTLKGEYETLLKENETREYTAEEAKAQETRFARMEAIQKSLDERIKFAKLALEKGEVTFPTEPQGKNEFKANADIKVGDAKVDKVEFGKAMSRWAITGDMDRRFATITTATQSGILLPEAVLPIESHSTLNAFREAHSILGRPVLATPGTGVSKVPVLQPAAGDSVAENDSSENENSLDWTGSIVLTPETFESKTAWISGLELGAPDYDITQFLEGSLEDAKEMGLENNIAADLIADSAITQGVDLAAGAVSYDNMVTLNNCLPRRYSKLKVMVLDGSLISALEKLVGADGHPILIPDPQNQSLFKFNGTPVLRCDGFANYGGTDGDVLGIIVSLLGFKLRDAGQRRVHRFLDAGRPDQFGFNLVGYHAYGWTAAAVGKIKN